jgi:hypothetical protein
MEVAINPEFKPKTKPLLTPEELEAKRILPDSPLRTMYEKRQRSSVFGSNRGNPLLADNNRPISVPPITVKGKPLQVKSFEETESDIAKSVQKLGKAKTLGERRSLSRSLKGKPKNSVRKAKTGMKVPTVYTPAYVFNPYAKFLEPAKVSTQNFSVAKPASSASGIIVKPNPKTP